MALRKWSVIVKAANAAGSEEKRYWTHKGAVAAARTALEDPDNQVLVTGGGPLKYQHTWNSLQELERQWLNDKYPSLYDALRESAATGDTNVYDLMVDQMGVGDWEKVSAELGRAVSLALADGITITQAKEQLRKEGAPRPY